MNKELYVVSNSKNFPSEDSALLFAELLQQDHQQWERISSVKLKDSTIALVLSICLGPYGIDRFYIGDVAIGIFKLLQTAIMFVAVLYMGLADNPPGIVINIGLLSEALTIGWYITDIFIVQKELKKNNYTKIKMLIK